MAIREKGIPFSLKLDVPNDVTAAAIEEGRLLAQNDSSEGYADIKDLKQALEE